MAQEGNAVRRSTFSRLQKRSTELHRPKSFCKAATNPEASWLQAIDASILCKKKRKVAQLHHLCPYPPSALKFAFTPSTNNDRVKGKRTADEVVMRAAGNLCLLGSVKLIVGGNRGFHVHCEGR